MKVVSCGIHGFSEAIGIDVDEFRVFWKLESTDEHETQAAYRLLVTTTKPNGNDGAFVGDCYDSGRVESPEQRDIICRPKDGFRPTAFHYWVVQVWNKASERATSAVNEFYTSYPKSSRLLPPYSMNQTYVGCLLLSDFFF